MVKGSQRRVIHVKNTKSGIFDEAYFILKEGADASVCESDMISEANRIIEENSKADDASAKRGSKLFSRKALLVLSFGASAVLAVLVLILARL